MTLASTSHIYYQNFKIHKGVVVHLASDHIQDKHILKKFGYGIHDWGIPLLVI